MELENFGARLKRLRENKNLSVPQLAQRAGVGKVTIWELECQKVRYPRVDTLILLADTLGVTLDELVGMTSKRCPYCKTYENVGFADKDERLVMFHFCPVCGHCYD